MIISTLHKRFCLPVTSFVYCVTSADYLHLFVSLCFSLCFYIQHCEGGKTELTLIEAYDVSGTLHMPFHLITPNIYSKCHHLYFINEESQLLGTVLLPKVPLIVNN